MCEGSGSCQGAAKGGPAGTRSPGSPQGGPWRQAWTWEGGPCRAGVEGMVWGWWQKEPSLFGRGMGGMQRLRWGVCLPGQTFVTEAWLSEDRLSLPLTPSDGACVLSSGDKPLALSPASHPLSSGLGSREPMTPLPAALPPHTHASQARFPVFRLHILSAGIPQDTARPPRPDPWLLRVSQTTGCLVSAPRTEGGGGAPRRPVVDGCPGGAVTGPPVIPQGGSPWARSWEVAETVGGIPGAQQRVTWG